MLVVVVAGCADQPPSTEGPQLPEPEPEQPEVLRYDEPTNMRVIRIPAVGSNGVQPGDGNCLWFNGDLWILNGTATLSWDAGTMGPTVLALTLMDLAGEGNTSIVEQEWGTSPVTIAWSRLHEPLRWNESASELFEVVFWISEYDSPMPIVQEITLALEFEYLLKAGEPSFRRYGPSSCSGNPTGSILNSPALH